MSCNLWRERLDAYIDGDCSPEDAGPLEEHLRACPSCSTEALHRLQVKRAVKSAAAARFAPSSEFRARIAQRIGTDRTSLFKTYWISGFAIAAAMLLAVLVATSWILHVERRQAFAELLDLHIATLASANPVDVVSEDRHTVKPWFQGKLPFSFNLPELDNTAFHLLGGKVVYFDHAPGAQLIYTSGKHEISVIILQGDSSGRFGAFWPASTAENGFTIETWAGPDLRYAVIGDTNPADLHRLAEMLRAAQRP